MHRVEPKVFLIGESRLDHGALQEYLDHIGTTWKFCGESIADLRASDPEMLVEVMGRLCYRSWQPLMNPNVTKVREGNREYIENILKSMHGSVLEHPVSHWIFADVSRVFTHELVRHRAGMAFSQESLRYVRLTDLGLWLPPEIECDRAVTEMFERAFKDLEELQLALTRLLGVDEEKSFSIKKKLTSAMRRVAPIGLATTIGATFNMRALRHVLEMRSSEAAEAEMRFVFARVGEIALRRWPSLFQDFTFNGHNEMVPKYHKV